MSYCAAKFRWTESEFWANTPRYVYNAVKGMVTIDRESWERSRVSWFYSVLQPGINISEITDLYTFEWEREAVEAKKAERIEAMKGIWDNWMAEIAAKKSEA